MQAELTAPAGRYPAAVVASRTTRRAVRSGALWGYVFGLTVASSAWGYASVYKTPAQRARLADLFASNMGLAAINGPAHEIQTVAGYTVWKSLMFLIIVGAVWGLLTGSKLLRGEEDAGRWELLLAGQTTPRRAAGQALAGLGAGLATLWALTAVITVVVGQLPRVGFAAGPSLFFSVALVAPAAMFLAAGALASQLAATRRQAAAYAGAALGACYALRMVADSGTGLAWLRWTSPLGWVEELQPLTSPRPLALLPIAGLVAVLGGLTLYLAGRRDLGASIVPDRGAARPRTRLLSGPMGLALRLVRPAVLGWTAAIVPWALLMGFLAKQGGSVLTTSASVERVASRLGTHGDSAAAYLGFTFLTVGWLVAFLAAGQVSAARDEEAEGRLDNLLVRPLSRTTWLAGRVALAVAILAVSGLLAGLFALAGAASQNAGVGLPSLLGAGVNVVPAALCVLGVGVLVMGVWPRATTAVTYGLLAWSLLIQLAGGFFSSNHWLLDTSVFHHVAAAPAESPNWTSATGLVATGAVAAVLGWIALRHRDLAGE
ncbi:MAG TPA: ABC transporter permease subunit [Streptosporangiaceae bacterium]